MKIINPSTFGVWEIETLRKMLEFYSDKRLKWFVGANVFVHSQQRNTKAKMKASATTVWLGDNFIKKKKAAVQVCANLAVPRISVLCSGL